MSEMVREWAQALERRQRRLPRIVDWDAAELVVQAVLADLQKETTVDALKKRFYQRNFSSVKIARQAAGGDLRLQDPHLTVDAAYGLRYLELVPEEASEYES